MRTRLLWPRLFFFEAACKDGDHDDSDGDWRDYLGDKAQGPDIGAPARPKACWFHLHKKCTKGNRCNFLHACKIWGQPVGCTSGEQCKFYHGEVDTTR
mmetsp:Transcript_993/g.3505  ORF Transcript_993/g.3505 Transcript_993/m.3505 type:complete len:98 (+) Transcript_993:2644-2937(+)